MHFLAHVPLEQVNFFFRYSLIKIFLVRNEGPSFLLFISQYIATDTQVSIVFTHIFCVFIYMGFPWRRGKHNNIL